MSPKQQFTWIELRVGIFVVVVCAVLALAIFAIGSQVGLFEKHFLAVTYLSNVSGLKPGDVVLLGGVEVGNVQAVTISQPGELPQTETNSRILQRVAHLMDQLESAQAQMQETESRLQQVRTQFRAAVREHGSDWPEARRLDRQVQNLDQRLEDHESTVSDIRGDIEDARSGLQNIEVEMRINASYRDWVREDSNISLGSIGLLGDKYIEISLGRTDQPPKTVEVTVSTWLGSETREAVFITGTQQASFGELITGANDILANFETLSSQVQDIVRNLEAGEGTVGKFLTNPEFFNNLNATIENANSTVEKLGTLISNIDSAGGTMSKLIHDDTLYNDLLSTISDMKTLAEKINSGEGTLGRFVNDPSVYQRSEALLTNLDDITGRMNRGEGTLGKLSTDDQLYVKLRNTVDELNAILKDVESGKGTLGQLTTNEQLYNNLDSVSSEIIKLIYDIRKDPKKYLTIRFQLF